MIQRQLKLKLSKKQEATLTEWLWLITGVYNWAIRKIELDARDGVYYTKIGFRNELANHSKKMGLPSHTVQEVLTQAYMSWDRCFKKIAKKPRLKGVRNKVNSIPFPDPIKTPAGNKIRLQLLGVVRFNRQELPDGKIKTGRIIRRASGWYLALNIDAEPSIGATFKAKDNRQVGVDPGFSSLLTLSDGEVIDNPRELNSSLKRLGQAQRGRDRKLAARINERVANRKKDRNHKLSRRLVEECQVIAFSKDNIKVIKKRFGKSVANANHYQLRKMLAYKSSACGREYVEVDSKGSTKTCSSCGGDTGPTGFSGLSVREWVCKACGAPHDRDQNAAINTLILAAGMAVEGSCLRPGNFVRNPLDASMGRFSYSPLDTDYSGEYYA